MTTKKQKPGEEHEPPFAFVRSLFSSPEEPEIVDRPADAAMVDRLASVHLTVAEKTGRNILRGSASPEDVAVFLGASREARECVRVRRELDAPIEGSSSGGTVTVKIEHSGCAASDDFDEMLKKP